MSRQKILVLEDDSRLAGLFADMLGLASDCDVSIAEDNDTAIWLLKETSFDVAFVDVGLKDGTSEATAEALLGQGIRFAFMSGSTLPGSFERKFPAAEVLLKPARMDQIREMLVRLGGQVSG